MECPVCSRVFPSASINVHVNECLNAGDTQACRSPSTEDPKTEQREEANAFVTSKVQGKRKSSSNWGSLQPMLGSNQSDSSSVSPTRSTAKKSRTGELSRKGKTDTETVEEHESEQNEELTEMSKHQNVPFTAQPGNGSKAFFNSGKKDTSRKSNTGTKADVFAPLAERMRPKDLADYVGQDKAVGRDSMLYSLLESDHIPSVILWGPPGCGKTTLARIIANNCRSRGNAKFVSLSAAVCGVNEVKETIKIARNDQKMFHKKTVMFLDEIHRFNKMQQDILLPHVEDGTITLIGATTENPSFQVNSALLSRCRVIVLEKLSGKSILSILQRALPHVGASLVNSAKDIPSDESASERPQAYVDPKALELLSNLVDGDARAALNGLQMAVQARGAESNRGRKIPTAAGTTIVSMVTTDDIKEGLQRSHVLYDKTGEEHYNIISALHKSMRGSDANAALYWLARMLEGGENPLYVARRLIRFASEDVGLADPAALNQAVAAYQGCHLIGMPECDALLAQCVVYLARAPKSVEIYQAYGKAKSCVRQHKGPLPSVPLHLRNAPTRLMKNLGYGKDYKYNPNFTEPVEQDYFPTELVGTNFFT